MSDFAWKLSYHEKAIETHVLCIFNFQTRSIIYSYKSKQPERMLTYNNKRLTIERLFRILEQECKEGEQNTWRQKQNFSQRNK